MEHEFLDVIPPSVPGPLKLGMMQAQDLLESASRIPLLTLQAVHLARAFLHAMIVTAGSTGANGTISQQDLSMCLELRNLGNRLESLFSSINLTFDAHNLEDIGEHQIQFNAYFSSLSSFEGVISQSENTFRTLSTIDWRRIQRLKNAQEMRLSDQISQFTPPIDQLRYDVQSQALSHGDMRNSQQDLSLTHLSQALEQFDTTSELDKYEPLLIPSTIRPSHAIVSPDAIAGQYPLKFQDVEDKATVRPSSKEKKGDPIGLCLDALYPCPETIRAILAPTPGHQKRILDIGCKTGAWCLDMAKEFPDVDILGIDKHFNGLTTLLDNVPANCHFETRLDYTFLIEDKFIDQFDLIQMRDVAGGCTQFLNTIDHIQACLRPGGIFILIDSTGDILTEDGEGLLRPKTHKRPTGSRLRRLFYEVTNANVDQGSDENTVLAILNEGLWQRTELIDCKAAELLVPIGPWFASYDKQEEQRLQQVGRVMTNLLQSISLVYETILKNLGFDDQIMQKWHEEILSELQDSSLRHLFDVRLLWGRREGGDLFSISTSSTNRHHPYLRIYDDPESWWEMIKRRKLLGKGGPDRLVPFVHKSLQSRSSSTRTRPLSTHDQSQTFPWSTVLKDQKVKRASDHSQHPSSSRAHLRQQVVRDEAGVTRDGLSSLAALPISGPFLEKWSPSLNPSYPTYEAQLRDTASNFQSIDPPERWGSGIINAFRKRKKVDYKPDVDEYVLFTVVNPYPPKANMELSNDRSQFAQWMAAVTGDSSAVIALYHKPSAPHMVLVSLTKTYQHHRRVLGRHYWNGPNGFLKEPPPGVIAGRSSDIFYCRYKLHSEVTKSGWKCFEFTDRMFVPEVQAKLFRNPYPLTTAAPGDTIAFDLCSPLPAALFLPISQIRVPDAPMGSSALHTIEKLQPAKPAVEASVIEESDGPNVDESPRAEEPTDLWEDIVSDLPLRFLSGKDNEDVCPYHGTTCKKMCAWRSAREKQKGSKVRGPAKIKKYNANKTNRGKFTDAASSSESPNPARVVTTSTKWPSTVFPSPRDVLSLGNTWERGIVPRVSHPGSPVVSSSNQYPIYSGTDMPESFFSTSSPSPWQPVAPPTGRGASPASVRGTPPWSSRARGRGRGIY